MHMIKRWAGMMLRMVVCSITACRVLAPTSTFSMREVTELLVVMVQQMS